MAMERTVRRVSWYPDASRLMTTDKYAPAPLMHELEDGHEYEFVEGTVDSPMSEGIETLASKDHRFYSLWNPNEPSTLVIALSQLDAYVIDEGPFDAVLGFSAGSILAALYILKKQQQGQQPFKCAVFLSAGSIDKEMKTAGLLRRPNELLQIPTAHIWGAADEMALNGGQQLFELCEAGPKRELLVHDGGHEVPRKGYLTGSVHAIRRAISYAM